MVSKPKLSAVSSKHRSRHSSVSSKELGERGEFRAISNPFSIDRILAPGARNKLLRQSSFASVSEESKKIRVNSDFASDRGSESDEDEVKSNGELDDERKSGSSEIDDCEKIAPTGITRNQMPGNSPAVAAALLCPSQHSLSPFQNFLQGFISPVAAANYSIATAVATSEFLGEYMTKIMHYFELISHYFLLSFFSYEIRSLKGPQVIKTIS